MGGLLRCESCGEVHWNLRLGASATAVTHCRVCGSELRAEPRPFRRRFDRIKGERRGVGGSASS